MSRQNKNPFVTIFIGCFCLMFGLPHSAQAQTETMQTAVFRDYQLKFEYDANRYVVYHSGDNGISISLRMDADNLPTGFNPGFSIQILQDDEDADETLQLYLKKRGYRGEIMSQTDVTVGALPAQHIVAAGLQSLIDIGLIQANGYIYIIEAAPNMDNEQLTSAAEEVQHLWEMVVGSMDFSPSELEQNHDTDCIDDSAFVSDLTIPDGSEFVPGDPFTKAWELENDGTCTWFSDYRLQLINNSLNWDITRWSQITPIVPYTEPEQTSQIALTLALSTIEPNVTVHQAQYQLANADGELFGTKPYVEVIPILDEVASPLVNPPVWDNPSRFYSDSFGISFAYPQGWVRLESNPDVVSLYSYDILSANPSDFTVPSNETKVEIIKRGAGSLSEIINETSNFSPLTLASGLPALRIDSPNPRDTQQTMIGYFIEVDGNLYEFQVFGDPLQVDAIVASVNVVK